jgi:hypothetical protein
MEGPLLPPQAPGPLDGIVSRIGKLSDDRKARLLTVLMQMEKEGDGEGGPAVEWADVEEKAGMEPNLHRYENANDDGEGEDDTPVWLEKHTQSAPDSVVGLGVESPPREQRRPLSGRRSGPERPVEDRTNSMDAPPSLLGLHPDSDLLHQFQQTRLAKDNTAPPLTRNGSSSPILQPSPTVLENSQGTIPLLPPSPFVVPLLPRGSVLTLNVLSTWGDPHYVGLTGLDIFDSSGRLVVLSNPVQQVIGDPHSINVLPEYKDDPRTADKIMDNVNCTKDDVHMWLAPFTEGCSHIINITFDAPVTISMIRVWNYNKSRVHSFRGARQIDMQLDGIPIFRGEVRQASGDLENCEKITEVILFTTEPAVLATLESYYTDLFRSMKENTPAGSGRIESSEEVPRPKTSGGRNAGRPTTAVRSQQPSLVRKSSTTMQPQPTDTELSVVEGSVVKIELLSTWGDMQNIGLSRITILDPASRPIPIEASMVSSNVCELADVAALFAESGPDSTFVVPLQPSTNPVTFVITFPQPVKVAGIRVWNYNRSLEDTFTGVKRLRFHVGPVCVSPALGTYVRKAPGHTKFESAHTIMLNDGTNTGPTNTGHRQSINVAASMNTQSVLMMRKARLQSATIPRAISETLGYEPVLLPVAYVFKFVLSSTLGDVHYVGLNGIELYDMDEKLIELEPRNLQSVPRDVSSLVSCQGDIRVLENLINGVNDNTLDENIWLAPFTPGRSNILYVIFEQPTAISLVKIWNYGKTPSRGVKDLSVFADDLLIFTGALNPAGRCPIQHQSLLFTANMVTVSREMKHLPTVTSQSTSSPAQSPTMTRDTESFTDRD